MKALEERSQSVQGRMVAKLHRAEEQLARQYKQVVKALDDAAQKEHEYLMKNREGQHALQLREKDASVNYERN
eukprot:12923840-Prorocentrum_lima.AAC.1